MQKEETKEEKNKKGVLVVSELPTQQLRSLVDKEGTEYDVLTIDEALTELVNNIRQIKKSVA